MLSTDVATWRWHFPKPSLLMNYLIKSSTTVKYRAQQCMWTCKSYLILWWREVKWTGAWPKLTFAETMPYIYIEWFWFLAPFKAPFFNSLDRRDILYEFMVNLFGSFFFYQDILAITVLLLQQSHNHFLHTYSVLYV